MSNNPQLNLYEVVQEVSDVEGSVVDIGTGSGIHAINLLEGMATSDQIDKALICVDPYGNFSSERDNNYYHEVHLSILSDRHALFQIHGEAPSVRFYKMKDIEWFEHFQMGLAVYSDGKETRETCFSLVHFDGPKRPSQLIFGVQYFNERTSKDGLWVFQTPNYSTAQRNGLKKICEGANAELVVEESLFSVYKK